MKNYCFTKALTPDGWHDNVLISINDQGIITHVQSDSSSIDAVKVEGYAIPGMPNIHSHAFQRAMAGLAEYSTSSSDSFWTWRDLMYRFAGVLTPEDLKIIAAQLYMEMLKSGYISVAEFHYLHHDTDGRFYPNMDEMSQAIMASATKTGIALTHLPVLYIASGFGGQPLKEGQKRFAHSADDFCALLTKLNIQKDNYKLGMALHSLRAVTAETMTAAIRHLESLDQNAPIHIHISEQMKEVDDCIEWSGKRPVEWLFDNAKIDARWCLIHATHLNDNEVDLIADSGATVGICPTTEANLGDGLFPLKDYMSKSGSIAIGSDSHISVSPVEELRLLEYGQRLTLRGRNIAATPDNIHTGDALYHAALSGGAKASGFNHGAIKAGMRADIITLDANSPLLAGTPDECLLDRFIFNGNQNMVSNVMVLGKFCVENYRHFDQDKITADYIALVKNLQKRVE